MSPMNPRLLRPRASGDPDALRYIAAVQTADGQTLEPAVAKAISDFVVGCKLDGIWTALKASCILSGARTLSGALTPLVGTAPTNSNFVGGDYDRKTGLVGNPAASKRLDSNRSNSADPQDSRHMAVYASQRSGTSCVYISTTTLNTNGDSYLYQVNIGNVNSVKLSSAGVPSNASGTNLTTGLYGASRASSSAITIRRAGANVTQNVNSTTPLNENLLVYGVTSLYADARLAFYSVGESLDLALLDTRVTNLINAIAAAI